MLTRTARTPLLALVLAAVAGAAGTWGSARAAPTDAAEPAARGPWRVFILSGQSNMEGKGAI
ncbi:MAG: hypothetical protein ACYSU0_21860, partial [Planctomycetota bacterium]